MSKRGSHNAVNFPSRNWNLSKKHTTTNSTPTRKKIKFKSTHPTFLLLLKKKREKIFLKNQFKFICSRFEIKNSDPNYKNYYKDFKRLKNKYIDVKILELIEYFELFAKKNDEPITIENFIIRLEYIIELKQK